MMLRNSAYYINMSLLHKHEHVTQTCALSQHKKKTAYIPFVFGCRVSWIPMTSISWDWILVKMLNILKSYTSQGFPYYVIKSIIVCVISSSFVTEGQVKSREQFNLKLSSAKFDKTFMQILLFSVVFYRNYFIGMWNCVSSCVPRHSNSANSTYNHNIQPKLLLCMHEHNESLLRKSNMKGTFPFTNVITVLSDVIVYDHDTNSTTAIIPPQQQQKQMITTTKHFRNEFMSLNCTVNAY